MDVNSILNSTNTSIYEDNKTKKTATTETAKSSSTNNDAAIYEKSKSSSSSVMDSKKIQSMIDEANQKTESLRNLIKTLFTKQASKNAISGKNSTSSVLGNFEMPTENIKAFLSGIEVDEATRAKAQEEISEDGYYGVKQTSARILDFAKAVAGNDHTKIEEMRKAVQKGFDQAERMWGDKLPEICQNTYDTVMSGFDSWAKEASGSAE